MNTAPIRKSLVAAGGSALFAGAAGVATAMSDGHLTGAELVIAGGLALGAFAAVGRATWRVPNDDKGIRGPAENAAGGDHLGAVEVVVRNPDGREIQRQLLDLKRRSGRDLGLS